jgi:hypothetical protein
MTQKSKSSPSDAARDGPTQDGRELESKHPAQQKHDDGTVAPLPHEADESPNSQEEDEPREIGQQAHEDLERGLQDTDRRGGAEYQKQTQKRTQADASAHHNSERKK